MREYRDERYGDYNRHHYHEANRMHEPHNERHDWGRHTENEGRGRRYRAQENHPDRYSSNYRGSMDDFYNTTYEVNNYSGVPRHDEYGLPHGSENDLGRISRGNPQFYNPDSFDRTRYRYSTGYNPNYDNPEEGDLYRNFDSRGNHGYRHDASYGNADEFRDFGNDHYGSPDSSGRY